MNADFYLIDTGNGAISHISPQQLPRAFQYCKLCDTPIGIERSDSFYAEVWGKQTTGFVYGGLYGFTVTKEVHDLFIDNNITGVYYSRVIVEGSYDTDCDAKEDGHEQPNVLPYDLWRIDVIGWGGHAHPSSFSLLKRMRLRQCKKCGGYRGLRNILSTSARNPSFSINRWDGSDCFIVYKLGIVVTARVIEMLELHSIQHWSCKKVHAIE